MLRILVKSVGVLKFSGCRRALQAPFPNFISEWRVPSAPSYRITTVEERILLLVVVGPHLQPNFTRSACRA